jgi:hypothetical protein
MKTLSPGCGQTIWRARNCMRDFTNTARQQARMQAEAKAYILKSGN